MHPSVRWAMRWQAFCNVMGVVRQHSEYTPRQAKAHVRRVLRHFHPEALPTVAFIARLKLGMIDLRPGAWNVYR